MSAAGWNEGANRGSLFCQIVLRGELRNEWKEWFGGLEVSLQPRGDTLLFGSLADQAALHGLLRKIRDLGMPLVSVTCDEEEA